MGKQIIKIESIDNKLKKSDNSLYLKINKIYSCFEENLFEKLKHIHGL